MPRSARRHGSYPKHTPGNPDPTRGQGRAQQEYRGQLARFRQRKIDKWLRRASKALNAAPKDN